MLTSWSSVLWLLQALLAVLPNMEPLAVARMGWILARKDPLASLEASQKLAQISQELAPKRHEQAQKQTPAAKQAPAIKRPQGAAAAPVPAPVSVREAVMSAWLNACKVHLQQGVQAPLRGQGQAAGRGFTAEHLAQVLYAVPRLSLR